MIKSIKPEEHAQETGPMQQVRELLFGAQIKEVEVRAQRQEERWAREMSDVREEFQARLDSLENFLKSETSSLMDRLRHESAEREGAFKSEQRERAEAFKEEEARLEALKGEQLAQAAALARLAKDLAAAEEGFERKLAKLSGTLDAAEHNLRQLNLTESGALAAKVEERYREALRVTAETASQIREDMVYRSAMASLFSEFALRLSGQWMGGSPQAASEPGEQDQP